LLWAENLRWMQVSGGAVSDKTAVNQPKTKEELEKGKK
jgi:hypothetical protein